MSDADADHSPQASSGPGTPPSSELPGDRFSGREVQLVELEQDHPGFNDPDYRRRRDDIARLAVAYESGSPLPSVEYNEVEQSVWREVWAKLSPLHEQLACREYLAGTNRFGFARDHIPSFAEINSRLSELEGFHLAPVAGLVMPLTFLEQLGNRRFLATQYMRHHSEPLYTPEPDVVHEYIGHIGALSHSQMADLNVAFGHAATRAKSPRVVEQLIRAYWYTLEFGLLEEHGEVRVYGAGILSSFGELAGFHERAELRPWDLPTIARMDYDPTDYQRALFVAPSFTQMRDDLLRWLDQL